MCNQPRNSNFVIYTKSRTVPGPNAFGEKDVNMTQTCTEFAAAK